MKHVCMVCIFVVFMLAIFEIIELNKAIIAMLFLISAYILNKED